MPSVEDSYIIQSKKTSEYLILVIVIFLLIGTWSIILYFATDYQFSDIKAYEICERGLCPTNRFTGEKRCPSNENQKLQYDPIFEVCNPSKGCINDATPYAVQSDGSTNLSGVCDIDDCRCVNTLTSPSYTQVLFTMVNGDLYSQFPQEQNRVIFTQTPNQYVGQGNNIPIPYSDPTTQFFEISPSLLNYLNPSVCADLYADSPEGDGAKTILECVTRNPCVTGIMAYVPKNSKEYSSFTDDNITGGVPLACVSRVVYNSPEGDNTCYKTTGKYYAPLFNQNTGLVTCYQTNVDH